MTRARLPAAIVLAAALALAPGLALARVGGGASMGSRGGSTFSAPPATSTAPFSAAPMQRSFTPREAAPSFGAPSYAPGYAPSRRSAFTSGLLGGLVGAGLGGMLFGHGLFGGIDGGGSVIGLLIQLALIFFIGRWLLRLAFGRQAFAGFGGGFGSRFGGGGGSAPAPQRAASRPPVAIGPADYAAFEQLLKAMQTAWSRGDLAGLRTVATPEMVGYFNEQMSELSSRGLHNLVQDVRLEKGDLAEAWSEGSREYATVAMRFSMLDWTENAQQEVVSGNPRDRTVVTEVWTFVRAPGGRWMLSAIQQAR